MRIAICDDKPENVMQVEKYINQYCREKGIDDVEIFRYFSASELLDAYPKNLDLLCLDVEMPGLNGIEAAREIRSFDEHVILIYMTNYAKYAIEGYSVHAYNYLLKPISYEVLCWELQSVFALIRERRGNVYSLQCQDGCHTFSENEIIMLETQGKNVILHTKTQQFLVYRSMKNMEETLSRKMYRIHTAYMVSMDAVVKINKETLILKTGKELPISRHRKKDFMTAYMHYIGGLL